MCVCVYVWAAPQGQGRGEQRRGATAGSEAISHTLKPVESGLGLRALAWHRQARHRGKNTLHGIKTTTTKLDQVGPEAMA